eukprot:COSAG02_NODE_23115_length_729_cov_38.382540_1_plen_58_part_10
MADQPEYPGADAWGDCDCAQSSTTSWAMSGVRSMVASVSEVVRGSSELLPLNRHKAN